MEYNAYYNCINMQFHTKYWFKTLNLISLLQNSIIALWGNNQSCMLTVVAGQAHYIIIYDFIVHPIYCKNDFKIFLYVQVMI